jgi:hypothetical protein
MEIEEDEERDEMEWRTVKVNEYDDPICSE